MEFSRGGRGRGERRKFIPKIENRPNNSAEDIHSEFFFFIPSNIVGRVIGRGGSKIQEFRSISGISSLEIPRDRTNDFAKVLLSGNDGSCHSCFAEIKEFLSQFLPKIQLDSLELKLNSELHGSDHDQYENKSIPYKKSNFNNQRPCANNQNLNHDFVNNSMNSCKSVNNNHVNHNKFDDDDDWGGTAKSVSASTHEEPISAFKLVENLDSLHDSLQARINSSLKPAEEAELKIDWDSLRNFDPAAAFKDCPAIEKYFYIEDPSVSNMSKDEVLSFRTANNKIVVNDMSKDKKRPIPNPVRTFEEGFRAYPEILGELVKQKFEKPTPIQCQGWPILLSGHDMIGIAQTGSGKTLAFLLPALIHTDLQPIPREERNGPNVMILSPTRELALQIAEEVKKYHYRGIKSLCVYGGGDRKTQVFECEKGVEIIIATPGRLYDLMKAKVIDVKSVTYVVLDEADRMLDMGFEPQIYKIMFDVRPDRQTIMTSATWNFDMQSIANRYLTDAMFVNIGSLDLTACHNVTQYIEMISDSDAKLNRLFEVIEEYGPDAKILIFCGRKVTADFVSTELIINNINCECIHGGRDQQSRENAIYGFRESHVRILVATDVASRGLDITDISHVVNYDLPRQLEEYVHRVGRTGRAGRKGISLSFIERNDWAMAKGLTEILAEANQEVPIELQEMAERFGAMKARRAAEGGSSRGRSDGRRGGRRNRNDNFF